MSGSATCGSRRSVGERLFVLALSVVLVATGCVYSQKDRADELANATPTAPTAEPADTGTPASAQTPNSEESEPDTPASAATEPGWVIVQDVANAVNVRSGPGTDNDVVTRADLGTTLPSTGQTALVDGDRWIEVLLDEGTFGWVHADFLGTTVQPTPTPLATPTPAATGKNLIVDQPNGNGQPLRTEPNKNATIMRRIEDGTVVIPTGSTSVDDDDRPWTEIRDGADTGWINARFLKSP